MRAPYTQLYLHLVWATWDRLHLLTGDVEQIAYAAIRAKCQELKCEVIAIGGIPDHIHLLVRLHPSVAVAELVKEVKGGSSHLMTHEAKPGEFFKWQGGYGAFTVSKSGVRAVQNYIERQAEHHRSQELWEDWEQTMVPENDEEQH
jgi:REP element-mobilizing transposase RayT